MPSMPLPTRPHGVPARLRWWLFRTLERLASLRQRAAPVDVDGGMPEPAVWVFASTIGELNATEPLLRRITARARSCRLVLVTDHDHYRDAFRRLFGDAVIHASDGSSGQAAALGRRYPPRLLLLAEIPARLSDAPCRFSYAYVREASSHGAAIALINGWLYHQQPSCTMDAIERRLFDRDYLAALDIVCVQTDRVRSELVAAGAPADRVKVVGNLKFDAMSTAGHDASRARSPVMLGDLIATRRATVVAGSVTMAPEQTAVLDAFDELRKGTRDGPLLVLAPRHPEKRDMMKDLCRRLETRMLSFVFRSEFGDRVLPADVDVLVLDTVGDLRDFYAAATVAHVGRNHNVLEPLAFGRPVSVLAGWNEVYPSYPVFELLRDGGALRVCEDGPALARAWLTWLGTPDAAATQVARAHEVVTAARGAVDRHLQALEPVMWRL